MATWKSPLLALAATAALAVATPAQAGPLLEIVGGGPLTGGDGNSPASISGVDGFVGNQGAPFGLELTRNTSKLTFEFAGSESGFANTFTGPDGVQRSEQAFTFMTLGNPKGLIDFFFTSGGVTPAILNNGDSQPVATQEADGTMTDMSLFIAILDNPGGRLGNSALIGFDDGGGANDDNHDDFIVRVTAIPVPATFGLLGLGLLGLGLVARRRA